MSFRSNKFSVEAASSWANLLQSVISNEYGKIGLELINKLSYFDEKSPVPISLFNTQHFEQGFKLLNDNQLITIKDDGKEFTINRFIPKPLENYGLKSIVSLLEDAINSETYSNQNVILIIDHAVSAWNHILDCSPDCQSILKHHIEFSIKIAETLIHDLESEDAVDFTEKCYKKYVDIYGSHAEITLYMKTLYGISLNFRSNYDQSLIVINKILIDDKEYVEQSDRMHISALYGKTNALLKKDTNIKHTLNLLTDTIRLSIEKYGENNRFAMGLKLIQIHHLYINENKISEALELIDETLRILVKSDPNTEKIMTLQYLLQKVTIFTLQTKFEKANNILNLVKSKIKYWDRYNLMVICYDLVAAALYLQENKIPETFSILTDAIDLTHTHLPENSVIRNELQRTMSTLLLGPNSEQTNNLESLENLHGEAWTDKFINSQYTEPSDLYNACRTESNQLIEYINQQDNYKFSTSSKPIASNSTYETISSLLLIDVFFRKITGIKYVGIGDRSRPSEYDLNAAAINICEKLESILLKTSTNQLEFDFSALQSVLRKALLNCSNGQDASKLVRNFIHLNTSKTDDDTDLNNLLDLVDKVIIDICNK